jgi:hypothetical protein
MAIVMATIVSETLMIRVLIITLVTRQDGLTLDTELPFRDLVVWYCRWYYPIRLLELVGYLLNFVGHCA